MSGVNCAHKPLEPSAWTNRLHPASENFRGLSLPHLPVELQRMILRAFANCTREPFYVLAWRERTTLLRKLCKFMAINLLAQLCMITILEEGNRLVARRDACPNPQLKAALSDLYTRDAITTMMMRTLTAGDARHCVAIGPAAFRCLKIVLKIHNAETKWYNKCLEAIANGRDLPPYRPGDSDEWQELRRSFRDS